MRDFEPTPNFISRVMADVRAYEAAISPGTSRAERFLLAGSVRYALSAAGGLLGIVNLARIVLTFISPAPCG